MIRTPVQTGLDSSGPARPAPHSDRPCLRAAVLYVLLTSRLQLLTPPPYSLLLLLLLIIVVTGLLVASHRSRPALDRSILLEISTRPFYYITSHCFRTEQLVVAAPPTPPTACATI